MVGGFLRRCIHGAGERLYVALTAYMGRAGLILFDGNEYTWDGATAGPQMFGGPQTIRGPLWAQVYGRWVKVPAFVAYGSRVVGGGEGEGAATTVYYDQYGLPLLDPIQNPVYGGGVGGTNFFTVNADGTPGELYGSVSTGSASFGGKFFEDNLGTIVFAAVAAFAGAAAAGVGATGAGAAAAGSSGGALTAADEALLTFGTGSAAAPAAAGLTATEEAALTFGTGSAAAGATATDAALATVGTTGATAGLSAADEAALTFGTGSAAAGSGAGLTAAEEAALTFGTGSAAAGTGAGLTAAEEAALTFGTGNAAAGAAATEIAIPAALKTIGAKIGNALASSAIGKAVSSVLGGGGAGGGSVAVQPVQPAAQPNYGGLVLAGLAAVGVVAALSH